MSGIGNYSTSMRSPIRTVYIGGTTSSSGGGGGGPNYWTLSGNNIYNNNTGTVGINTSNPDISYNLDVSGSVRIRGNLIVDGSSTIIDTNILQVEDPLIQLGINNPADLKASGFYTEYRDVSNNKKYTGLVRPPQGSGYVLLNNSSTEPSDLYPDISSVSTSYLSVERLGVNKPLSALSNFFVDISGLARVWTNRVLIGSNAGEIAQDSNTISIGNNAGNNNQGLNSIALGLNSAYYFQQPNAIAIGRSAGAIAQGQNTLAMGYMAGEASQNTGALCLGYQAGRTFQGTNSIAIGINAGEINQGCNAIAIGNQAGQNNQCNNTIVLNASGTSLNTSNINGLYIDPIRNSDNNKALYYNTITKEITYSDISSIPQGKVYGEYLLYNGVNWIVDGSKNIAIGYNSGRYNQDISAVAIGFEAGYTGQRSNAVAIGNQAGKTDQSSNSIAIGYRAGFLNQNANTIILNASSTDLNSNGDSRLFINPIRNDVYDTVMGYNTTTKEVVYKVPVSVNYQLFNPTTTLEYTSDNSFSLQPFFKGAYQSAVVYNGSYEWEMYINIYSMTNLARVFYVNFEFANGGATRGGWYVFNDTAPNSTQSVSVINNWQFVLYNPVSSPPVNAYNTDVVISPTVTSTSAIIYAKGFFHFEPSIGNTSGTFTPKFRVTTNFTGTTLAPAKMNSGNYLKLRRLGGSLTSGRVIGEWV